MEDDLEEALRLKKEVIGPLKAKLASDEAVDQWFRSPGHKPTADLDEEAVAALGATDARPFLNAFAQPLRESLAALHKVCGEGRAPGRGDLAAAATLEQEARTALALVEALPVKAQQKYMRQWVTVLAAAESAIGQVEQSLRAARELPADSRKALMVGDESPGAAFLQHACVLCSVCRILRATICHHATYFAPSAVDSGAWSCCPGNSAPASDVLWQHPQTPCVGHTPLCSALGGLPAETQALVDSHPSQTAEELVWPLLMAALKESEQEANLMLTREDAHAWAASSQHGPVALRERCALTLLPLAGRDGIRESLPQAVVWDGRPYHCPCVNLWANCVSNKPPPAATHVSRHAVPGA